MTSLSLSLSSLYTSKSCKCFVSVQFPLKMSSMRNDFFLFFFLGHNFLADEKHSPHYVSPLPKFHFIFFVYGEEDWTRFRSNSSRSLLPRHFYQFFFPFSLYYLLYTVWWPMIVRFYSPHTLLTRVYIIIISRYDKERMVEEKKLGNDAEAERKSTEDVYNKLISIFFLSSVFARLFDRETSWIGRPITASERQSSFLSRALFCRFIGNRQNFCVCCQQASKCTHNSSVSR